MLLETKNVARRNKRSCQKHNTLTTENTFAFSSTLRPGWPWLAWLHIFLWRQGLGTRRWFSKVNMAAAGKRAGRTNVFWSKDRILSVTCSTNLLIPDYVANIIADSFW